MTASHVVLILPITIALLWHARRIVFASIRWSCGVGAFAVLLGISFLFIVHARVPRGTPGSLSLSVSAVVMLWIAGFVLFYGDKAARAALFPLMFLGFMVPVPPAVLNPAISALKSGSASTVDALFTLVGTPHYREGFVFSLPTVVIEIADECSGIRSTFALLLTSLLAGHLFLASTWHKCLLAVAVVPITILKNAVRIVSLCLLAIHYNPGFLAGRLHHEGGIVFYLLGLALLTPLLTLFHRWDSMRPSRG